MDYSLLDIFSAGAGMMAVWLGGVTRVRTMLSGLAVQVALLAAICVIIGVQTHGSHYFILAVVVLLVKGMAIPWFLCWATTRLGIREDRGFMLTPTASLLLGCLVLGASYFAAPLIATPLGHAGAGGITLALVLLGLLVMIVRRLAISQIIGFLVLENGIFLYGLTQTHGMPLVIEMGVIFDILLGVLIAGLVIFRLNRSFEHVDVSQLRGLRH